MESRVILLDTNILIGMLVKDSSEAGLVKGLISAHHQLITSSVNWYEFMSGPVGERAVDFVLSILDQRITPWTRDQAKLAVDIWNATGRLRNLRIDAMVAAAALGVGAALATRNREDFAPFESLGLELYPI